MMRFASLILVVAFLVACGEQSAPQNQQSAAQSKPAPSSAAPAAPALPAAAAVDDEELVYDPIDVSKLENQWWTQYSAGG